ncbi:MAG TPA: type VI secretion system protein TssA [Gemmatimonadaceae bacterium]|nr:type VI secretion system protein TssA [Gemmatimonadaceae bacterium]
MPVHDDLLTPIAGDNPAGADLRYEPVYDQVKEARREEDDAPQGEWQHARKVADYAQVLKLAGDALASRSKDLQLAAWYTEALTHREGFAGLLAGLEFLRGLLEQFWEHLYPELEDGDAELRATPLEWVGLRLDTAVKSVPLTARGYNFLEYSDARALGYEGEGDSEARAQAVAAGKLTLEEFDQAVEATPKAWYKARMAELDGTLAALGALDELGREKFGDLAPSYRVLREALEAVHRVVRQLLDKKLELEPDPLEPEADAAEASEGDAQAAGATEPGSIATEPSGPADAAARIINALRFLRHAEPTNPVPYLMLRALRWGELRAMGGSVDPRLLEAPSGHSRTQLRRLLLDARWTQLLEAAETVMATPAGRGWLDLQRYVLTACEGLGGEYEPVARVIRSELVNLLTDVPDLPGQSLMDDMPAANQETREWLRTTVPAAFAAPQPEQGAGETPDDLQRLVRGNGRDHSFERAMADVRAGHPERAIERLMHELDREKSRRGRFLRQAQLARIMVDSGLESVAKPILEEMMNLVESHRLEEWEPGDLVAEPMVLLYRCIEKAEGDASTMHSLYLRICRLDPVQAIGFAKR